MLRALTGIRGMSPKIGKNIRLVILNAKKYFSIPLLLLKAIKLILQLKTAFIY